MAKIDITQLAALADLADTLPALKKEIAEIEKSIGRLNSLLGKKAGKRRGRKPGPKPKGKGKPGPKPKKKPGPKPKAKKATMKGKPGPKPKAKRAVKKTTGKKRGSSVKAKVLAAIGSKSATAAELKKVDGRANEKLLKNMVQQKVLKVAGGKYSKA